MQMINLFTHKFYLEREAYRTKLHRKTIVVNIR